MDFNHYKKSLLLVGVSFLSIYGLYKSNNETQKKRIIESVSLKEPEELKNLKEPEELKKNKNIIESLSLKETEEFKKKNRSNLIDNLRSRLIEIEKSQNNNQNDSKYFVDISNSDVEESFNIENPSINDYKQELIVDTDLKKYYHEFSRLQTNNIITPVNAVGYFIKTKKTSIKLLKSIYKLCKIDLNMSLNFEMFCLLCEHINNEME